MKEGSADKRLGSSTAIVIPPILSSRPSFLPLTLWFAYLLRDDVRGRRSFRDAEALRDFCCWWLVYGKAEYPAVWGVTEAVAGIAMAPVVGRPGTMPRLLHYLWESRADLQAAFPIVDADSLAMYLCWYRIAAKSEIGHAPPLPEAYIALTEATPSSMRHLREDEEPLPRMALMLAALLPEFGGMKTHALDFGSAASRRPIAAAYERHRKSQMKRRIVTPPAPLEPRLRPRLAASDRRGVTLIGFAEAASGLGEDLRMFVARLDDLGIPHRVIDLATVAKMGTAVEKPAFGLSLFCMSPFDTATLWLRHGRKLFDDRCLVAYWAWELEQWPEAWHEAALLVDEIWTHSRYSEKAFAMQPYRTVRHLPPVIRLPPVTPLPRRNVDLDERDYVFLCVFDPRSYLSRKNPAAAIRAFRLAFAASRRSVRLLLRVNGTLTADQSQMLDRDIQQDERIRLLQGEMSRGTSLALLAACDCLVSLHRAEGFGRNIAEAKALGRAVIATGYSGCLDFLAPEDCIGFTRVPVAAEYPFGEGQSWAEPDIAQAADRMKALTRRHAVSRKRVHG